MRARKVWIGECWEEDRSVPVRWWVGEEAIDHRLWASPNKVASFLKGSSKASALSTNFALSDKARIAGSVLSTDNFFSLAVDFVVRVSARLRKGVDINIYQFKLINRQKVKFHIISQ